MSQISFETTSYSVEPGTVYVIGTPIGNLSDITLRGLAMLAQVDTIYAEDTRVSRKILDHYGFQNELKSFRQSPNPDLVERVLKEVLFKLSEGKSLAYITDAGTPGVSDPGSLLVDRVRKAGFKAVPIPGPAAFVTLLSATGIPAIRPLFLGFLPKKKGHQTLMGKVREALLDGFIDSMVCYESPERIIKLLSELAEWGVPGLSVSLGRELTKMHEEILRGPVEEVLADLQKRVKIKGEIALVVYIAK